MRLPRWKKEQKEKKSRQLKAKVKFLMAVVILSGIIFVGFSLFKIYTTSVLSKNGRMTIVFNSQPLQILSYEQKGEVVFISFPANTYLEAIRGYGQYRAGSLYALGKLEKKGGELLAGSVQEFLGVAIDGWVGLGTGAGSWELEAGSAGIKKLKVGTMRNLKTNLSVFDLARIWWKIRRTRADKIRLINLQDKGVLTKYVLPDKSEGLTADQAKLDYQLAQVFKDQEIVAEHLAIEVLNGSEKPEMANRAARLITNLGGTVISLGNSEKESSRCQLKGSSEALKSFTGQRLKKIFNCQEVSLKKGESRADLQLVIGLDYWQKLHLQP